MKSERRKKTRKWKFDCNTHTHKQIKLIHFMLSLRCSFIWLRITEQIQMETFDIVDNRSHSISGEMTSQPTNIEAKPLLTISCGRAKHLGRRKKNL